MQPLVVKSSYWELILEYLIEYGIFLAKAATIVVAIVIVVGTVAAAGSKQKKLGKKGSLKVTRLNDHIDELRDTLRQSVLDKDCLLYTSPSPRDRG